MVANRGKLVFQMSIIINVIVLFYAALHLSGTHPSPQLEWVQVTSDEVARDETVPRNEELTSMSNQTPSTLPSTSTNKTTSSTTSISDVDIMAEAKLSSTPNNVFKRNSEETSAKLRSLLGCNNKDFLPEYHQRGEYWVLKNFVRAEHGSIPCYDSVTYTTHAGYEFLDNVLPLVERWQEPVSLAIYAPGEDIVPTVDSIRYLRECLETDLVKTFVTFHIFFPNKHVPDGIPNPDVFLKTPYECPMSPPYANVTTTYAKEKKLLYPVNVARNIARDAALTHFVLASDIELYPSPNLVTQFLEMIARNPAPLRSSKNPRVFPISIFEIKEDAEVPTTKGELVEMLNKKTAITFHKHMCQRCHNIPNGDKWMKEPESKQMDIFHVGKRKGKFVSWEPIYIGTHQDPHYDERLSWEGKRDKMTQGYILCVKDYNFMILNNAFLVHKPGIKYFKKNRVRDQLAARQSNFITKTIMPELNKLFGTRPGCIL